MQAASQAGAGGAHVIAKDVKLVHVAVLFRHGDRTPLSRNVGDNLRISTDEMQFWISRLADHMVIQKLNNGTRVVASEPNQQRGFREPEEPHHGGRWPCGQLTSKGIREMQANGQALRAKYATFIDGMDPLQHVYVLSTNVRRTIRSAQSVLCGMFPEVFESAEKQYILVHADEHSRIAPSHSYELFGDLGLYLAEELKQNAPPSIISTGQRIRDIVGIDADRRISWTGRTFLPLTLQQLKRSDRHTDMIYLSPIDSARSADCTQRAWSSIPRRRRPGAVRPHSAVRRMALVHTLREA